MRRSIITGAAAALLVGCLMAPASAEEPVDPAAPVVEAEGEEAAVEEPAAEDPVAEEPVAEDPAAEEPAAEEPAAEEPVAEDPVAEEPVAEDPAAEEPAVEDPVAEDPAAEEPAAEDPVAEEPVAEDPVALAAPAAPPAAAPAADPKDGELVDISSAYGVPPNLRHNASIVTITRDGCLLTITVKIEVDGSYTLEIWDDGELIGSIPLSGKAGDLRVVQYLMTANVGARARGYDFLLINADNRIVAAYDWDFEGSAQVMAECHKKATCEAASTAEAEQISVDLPAPMMTVSPKPVAAAPVEPVAAPAETVELAQTGTQAVNLGVASVFLMAVGALAVRGARRRA
ncbi:hypothetical protein [Actinomyces oricola]